jgi:CBS domain-containing protein
MKKNKIHRVIVEDPKTSTFTGFITYETVYEYFISNYYSDMLAFHLPVNELNIKTKNPITVNKNETIYSCLLKIWNTKISVLPVLDEKNKYFGFFFLKDIVYFFSNGEKFSVKINLI